MWSASLESRKGSAVCTSKWNVDYLLLDRLSYCFLADGLLQIELLLHGAACTNVINVRRVAHCSATELRGSLRMGRAP